MWGLSVEQAGGGCVAMGVMLMLMLLLLLLLRRKCRIIHHTPTPPQPAG